MKDAIIAIVIVVLLVAGFWWTRGAGGIPGGVGDPAREDVIQHFDQFGGPTSSLGKEHEDRAHEIE